MSPRSAAAKNLATTFGAYLAKRGLAYGDVAKALGISLAYVQALASGKQQRPSAEVMWLIERWSGGRITMQSWFKTVERT